MTMMRNIRERSCKIAYKFHKTIHDSRRRRKEIRDIGLWRITK